MVALLDPPSIPGRHRPAVARSIYHGCGVRGFSGTIAACGGRMLIMGLDPGSACTGFGLIAAEGNRIRWRRSGLIRPPKGRPLAEKLHVLHQELRQLLLETKPDIVAIEESFVGRHARSALVLGHARGALIVAALSLEIPLVEYAPRLIKLAVTGIGSARKEQVHAMVGHLADEVPADLSLDETDALAVAICHAHRGRPAAAAIANHSVVRGI